MKTILIAALLLALPVLAHDRDDDDDRDDEQARVYYPAPQDPFEDSQVEELAPPQEGPTYQDFRNDSELSWNGEWIDTPEYGTVWRPTRVNDSWQPYAYGRWAWTTAGWAWISDEPFGWAVYHYGRWAFTPAGWLWIPGRVWAPAWVSWRWGGGYAGWCPLGPRSYVYQQPAQYVFVRNQHFLEPVPSHVVVPRALGQGLPPPAGRGPYAGPPVHMVEQVTGRAVRPLAVADAPAPHAAQATSGSVQFYRPRSAPVAISRPEPRAGEQRPFGPGSYGVTPRQGGQPRSSNDFAGPRSASPGFRQSPSSGSPSGAPPAAGQYAPRPGAGPYFPHAGSGPSVPRAPGASQSVPRAAAVQSPPHAKER